MKVYDAYADASKKGFVITRPSEHRFEIHGEEVESYYHLINLSTDAGVSALISYLDHIGVDEALKEKGAIDGDLVCLCDFEFEYFE